MVTAIRRASSWVSNLTPVRFDRAHSRQQQTTAMQTARSVQTHLCIHTPVVVLPAEHPAPSGAPSEQTTETSTSSALQLTFFRRSLSVIACSCPPLVELTGHRSTDQISFFPRSEPFSLPIRRRDQCLYRFSFLIECGKKFVRPLYPVTPAYPSVRKRPLSSEL